MTEHSDKIALCKAIIYISRFRGFRGLVTPVCEGLCPELGPVVALGVRKKGLINGEIHQLQAAIIKTKREQIRAVVVTRRSRASQEACSSKGFART